MPGLLKPDACCPICTKPLLAIVDTTNRLGVIREYIHLRPDAAERPPECSHAFADHEEAKTERAWLEGKRVQ